MAIQTLTVDKKEFAILPLDEYRKLLELIEDLQDLADVKKRAKEPRISLDEVKRQYRRKSKK